MGSTTPPGDVTSLCIICIKPFSKPASRNDGPSLELLLEHLQLETGFNLDSLQTCGVCSSLLKEYGNTFKDWKALELELESRIKEIANLARCASQVTRRREAFKTWCDNLDNGDQDKMGTTLKQLRSKLRRQCKKVVTEAHPRVQLRWVNQDQGPPESNETISESVPAVQLPGIDNKDTTTLDPDPIPPGHRDTTLEPLPSAPSLQIGQQSTSDKAIIPGSSNERFVLKQFWKLRVRVKSSLRKVRKSIPEIVPAASTSDPVVSSTSQRERAPILCPPVKPNPVKNRDKSPVKIMYMCYKCNDLFSNSNDLRRHIWKEHRGFPIKVLLQSVQRKQGWGRPRKNFGDNANSASVQKKPNPGGKSGRGRPRKKWGVTTTTSKGVLNKALHLSNRTAAAKRKLYRFCCSMCPGRFAMETNLAHHLQRKHIQDLKIATGNDGNPSLEPVPDVEPATKKMTGSSLEKTDEGGDIPEDVHKPCEGASSTSRSGFETVLKLDAELDYICPFCNQHSTNRESLECHIARCHHLHHENAGEYQRMETEKGEGGIVFCPFCGFQGLSGTGMELHLRQNHFDSLGVPKKTLDKESEAGPSAVENVAASS